MLMLFNRYDFDFSTMTKWNVNETKGETRNYHKSQLRCRGQIELPQARKTTGRVADIACVEDLFALCKILGILVGYSLYQCQQRL